jgi:branched-chain amino acid aminotransferase
MAELSSTGNNIWWKNEIRPVSELPFMESTTLNVYEVVRVENGVPLFIRDHLLRLEGSIGLAGKCLPDSFHQLSDIVLRVIQHNNPVNCNIRVDYFFTIANHAKLLVHFIPSTYPSVDDYSQGVLTELQLDERTSPNAKIADTSLRSKANLLISTHHLYETLLVNSNGLITEGSRSNLFAIVENQLYTAPDELVLKGVMRRKVLDSIAESHFSISFKALHQSELHLADALFLTGTSPRVLPIQRVGDATFDPQHPIIKTLQQAIEKKVSDYLLHFGR